MTPQQRVAHQVITAMLEAAIESNPGLKSDGFSLVSEITREGAHLTFWLEAPGSRVRLHMTYRMVES